MIRAAGLSLALAAGLGAAPGAAAMVMNNNRERLPPGCEEVAAEREVTVHAGRRYAEPFPGKVFTFDKRVYRVPRCTRLTVTFVSEDAIRHQWMVHGLPRETYPGGMFTIEVSGPGRDTGTLILPAERKTYMLHCGLPQHMQKGMKGEIRVAGGDRRAANVPGVTGAWGAAWYARDRNAWLRAGVGLGGVVLGVAAGLAVLRRIRRRRR